MNSTNFTLISKTSLTNDVFELIYEADRDLNIIPGQFITFILPKTKFARAYSVLDKVWNKFYFIIKRVENGRWWSKEICDWEINTILKWVWPTGHFLDTKKINNKLFIWTWTWIVPLYFIINNLLENGFDKSIALVLWNRTSDDLYYLDKLSELKNKYNNFEFHIYLSRQDLYNNWYVSNFLNNETCKTFDEFYICWNWNMVDDVSKKLGILWVWNENVFYEKF